MRFMVSIIVKVSRYCMLDIVKFICGVMKKKLNRLMLRKLVSIVGLCF